MKGVIFDERSPRWEKNGCINGLTLANCEYWLNDMLQTNRCLLLRDVYEQLCIPITRESLVAGWTISSVPHFNFKLRPKLNGVFEVVLPDMESDIRYAFPSGKSFPGLYSFS